jgi:hypothetical protein
MGSIFVEDMTKGKLISILRPIINRYWQMELKEKTEEIKINLISSRLNFAKHSFLGYANSCELKLNEEEEKLYFSLNFFRLKVFLAVLGLSLSTIFLENLIANE